MNSPHKTGVLTFHRCINYGSYWQARCLVDELRTRGHDAVLLDHNSPAVNRAEWKCALQPVLPAPTSRADRALYRHKMEKFFCAFAALPLSPRFALEQPDTMETYDAVVVGSDEVWNLNHPWYGGCALFFGAGVRSKRLISYAASFGNYDAGAGLEDRWAQLLRAFAALSVRDENSRAIVAAALGTAPEIVLDPCLAFPPHLEGNWRGPREPFVAVYGHNFSPSFRREVRRWAQARDLLLLSVGYRNDWADAQWLDAGPHDFAHAIARAEAVATNFFHGCAFALHHERPFVCETSFYRSHKVQGLMATVGAQEHLADAATPAAGYDALLQEPLDSAVIGKIARLRQSSAAYLGRALA